jgi:hypothetical protein
MLQGQGNEGATGVTAFEGAEAGLEPIALFAVTVKVYEVPLLSPVTVVERTGPLTDVAGWGDDPTNGVTVYPVMADPPSDEGALQDKLATVLPAVAVTFEGDVGACGSVLT